MALYINLVLWLLVYHGVDSQKVGKRGGPKKTWQDALRDDLQTIYVSSGDARSVADDNKQVESFRRPMFQWEQNLSLNLRSTNNEIFYYS